MSEDADVVATNLRSIIKINQDAAGNQIVRRRCIHDVTSDNRSSVLVGRAGTARIDPVLALGNVVVLEGVVVVSRAQAVDGNGGASRADTGERAQRGSYGAADDVHVLDRVIGRRVSLAGGLKPNDSGSGSGRDEGISDRQITRRRPIVGSINGDELGTIKDKHCSRARATDG